MAHRVLKETEQRAYEIKKVVKENGELTVTLYTEPLVGIFREAVEGENMVQLVDNEVLAIIPKKDLIFVYNIL